MSAWDVFSVLGVGMVAAVAVYLVRCLFIHDDDRDDDERAP